MTVDDHREAEFTIDLPKGFGKLMVCNRDGRLTRVMFSRDVAGSRVGTAANISPTRRGRELEKKLRSDFLAYFSGKEVAFDYPLELEGFTRFQRAVWAAMRGIPYGETRSYQWIAEKIGKARAARAVGNACGKNPFPIFQPCHRVVGSKGRLGGFGGGLDLKKALLQLEGVDLSRLR